MGEVVRVLSDRDLRRVAAEADLDPRTVYAVLVEGRGCLKVTRVAIAAALRKLGFETEAQTCEASHG